jgi:hypothetical protein
MRRGESAAPAVMRPAPPWAERQAQLVQAIGFDQRAEQVRPALA